MSAACARVPVLTTALNLPLDVRQAACKLAAGLALHNNVMLVIVGQTCRGDLLLCADECCVVRPGVIAIVPDVEAISRWGSVPKGAMRMESADGRTAYGFRGGAR